MCSWKRGVFYYIQYSLLTTRIVFIFYSLVVMKWNQHWRWILIWLSLIVVAFVGRFTKGIDIAGWVEFIYKIDFSKYREIYTKDTEFATVTQQAKNIIISNIRKRVNGLWVGDAEVKIQKSAWEDYVVVRIGGITDLAKARDIIGKTVELEFALPNTETGSQQIASRKQLATSILNQAIKNPSTLKELWDQGSNDVYYFQITGASKQQLPAWLINATQIIGWLSSWEVSSSLFQWLFQQADPLTSGSTDVNWFFIVRSLGKTSWSQSQLSDQELLTKASNKWYTGEDNFGLDKIPSKWDLISNAIYYDKDTKRINLDLWDPFAGKVAYQLDMYLSATTWSSAVDTGYSFDSDFTLLWMKKYVDKKRASAEQLPWLAWLDDLTAKSVKVIVTWGQTIILKVYNKKDTTQPLYRNIFIDGVSTKEEAISFIADVLSNDSYNLDIIFVRDMSNWISAQDDQKRLLNGAYFKFASVTRDQVGRPSVQIDLDDTGKDIFCKITQSNIKKQMAIFVGWKLITAPVIQDKICGWSAIINGDYDIASAKTLAESLNEWALPAKLIQVNETKVDATLGKNARKWALRATLLSLILILLLMHWKYGWKKALIGMISVMSFLIVLVATLKLMWYALSLSGMAAIILNIGMGIDAAILIYERLHEELQKGKRRKDAIYEAYDRARPAIFWWQMSTLAIGIVLVLLWSDLFQWFWVVMTLNIIILLIVSVPLIKEMLWKRDSNS